MSNAPGVNDRPTDENTILSQVQRWQNNATAIDDATAVAIAQLYHGPTSPETTRLGQGTPFDPNALIAEIEVDHLPNQPEDELLGRPALRALSAWTANYQQRTHC
ncbi:MULTISPECIES: hypothetical protein [Mycolicibacter]|uniref:Uncharacterized protein n=2 Tax=Mycolicibacter TaxID=1073531 RepID=A0ABU5XM42_9MYCO|nr:MULTISPECIES: hypothetical protein [unclassified Mycolicibacter]MEB3023340.1 hypothetical protein [Mycolicibacter sp. MYC098]MEB3035124.1 hypothetical protein [Mycolicibacter sp. MYC340]